MLQEPGRAPPQAAQHGNGMNGNDWNANGGGNGNDLNGHGEAGGVETKPVVRVGGQNVSRQTLILGAVAAVLLVIVVSLLTGGDDDAAAVVEPAPAPASVQLEGPAPAPATPATVPNSPTRPPSTPTGTPLPPPPPPTTSAVTPGLTCMTSGGSAEGATCSFPFEFQDTTYNECTTDGADVAGVPWCWMADTGTWGNCDCMTCTTVGGTAPEGTACTFPFTWRGVSHTECTTDDSDSGLPWCFVGAGLTQWGDCECNRPVPPPTPPAPDADFENTLDRDADFGTAAGRVEGCGNVVWTGSFASPDSVLPWGTMLHGDAHLDGRFGAFLDGDGDYISVGPTGDTSGESGYTGYGDFSVSLWFTKRECEQGHGGSGFISGRYESIYRQTSGDDHTSFTRAFDSDGTNEISIFVACSDAGVHSTVDGDIIRTILVDEQGARATFDWSVSSERAGGYVTSKWVHLVLSVSSTAVLVFVDGAPVTEYGYALPDIMSSGSIAWAQTNANLAYPNGPARLSSNFGSFVMIGPASDIQLGGGVGSRWRSPPMFDGEIALLSLHAQATDAASAQCLFTAGEALVGVCPDPEQDSSIAWVIGGPGDLSRDATLVDDAMLSGASAEFGVEFDGNDDELSFAGSAASTYSADGSFGISMWFTRRECTLNSRQEMLFAQQQEAGEEASSAWSSGQPENSAVSGSRFSFPSLELNFTALMCRCPPGPHFHRLHWQRTCSVDAFWRRDSDDSSRWCWHSGRI